MFIISSKILKNNNELKKQNHTKNKNHQPLKNDKINSSRIFLPSFFFH